MCRYLILILSATSYGNGYRTNTCGFWCNLPLVPFNYRKIIRRNPWEDSFLDALLVYAIYFPMHYQGFVGVPRRYFEIYDSPYIETSTLVLNQFITIAALIVVLITVFLYNLIVSARLGKKSEKSMESKLFRIAHSSNATRARKLGKELESLPLGL